MVSILPLKLDQVVVSKRGKRIVGPVSFEIMKSSVTIVLGPNGAGKTTLLRAMHGLERVSSGTLNWAQPKDEAERRQSFVFQSPIILRRSVLDNVAFPLQVRGMARGASRDRAADWVERIGLGDAGNRPATALSAGERQKLAVARALIIEPEIVFLDEPTANLDGHSTRAIEELIRQARDSGTTIVLATHNLGQARRLGTEAMFVHEGMVQERADIGSFFEAPASSRVAAFLRGDIVE